VGRLSALRHCSRDATAALVVSVTLFVASTVCVTSDIAAAGAGETVGAGPDSGQVVRAATRATNRAFKGTNRNVDPTPRAAIAGKHVVIISPGQASISAEIAVTAAEDAAKTIGWQADVYDARLDPANYAPLVRQAIAARVDGILLGAIDCQTVEAPLREAREAGITVVGVGAFDCNDPHAGGEKKGLFSAQINFGPQRKNTGGYAEAYGADQANYVIAKSRNRAKILALQDPEFTTLYYAHRGFRKTIERSRGSEIVSTLEITTADFTGNRLVPKIQAELVSHPEVNWIKSPFTYATTLGVVPALGANPRRINVMGGEGFAPELDLIREKKITAVNIYLSEWLAWAGVDTMNSAFRDEPPVDSGVGWVLADRTHNVPDSGAFRPPVDYRAQYRKVWGVT
jgi:ribose transport system substrate-binding protein